MSTSTEDILRTIHGAIDDCQALALDDDTDRDRLKAHVTYRLATTYRAFRYHLWQGRDVHES